MAIALFFKFLRWLGDFGHSSRPEPVSVREILRNDTWVTVHMVGAETFERVRIIGFTNRNSIKTHILYDLSEMIILEDDNGRRIIVRAKAIRMIVIEPTPKGAERA